MSPTKQLVESFQMLSLQEQVRRALPIARERLLEGIDSTTYTERTIVDRVVELMGDDGLAREYDEASETQSARIWDRLEAAAQALGIALGLLLRRDMFEGEGGAR